LIGVNKFVYTESDEKRVDKFLVSRIPSLSRSRLQSLIKNGAVMVDEQIISKSGFVLESGMTITVDIPEVIELTLIAESIELDIIFENDDLLIINKPSGMVVHPAAGHGSGTLVHAALAYAPGIQDVGNEHRPGVVHRLDKDTSGLILMAKNNQTFAFLQEQFRNRSVKKTYLAIIDGAPPTLVGRIEAPIGRDPSHRKKMAIISKQKGRASFTEYRVIESFKRHTIVEAQPLTGRTHQIRLHMAFLGCPIVGDRIYGHRAKTLDVHRQMLHAYKIEIMLPGENFSRTFEAPIPDDMADAILQLRNLK